MYGITDAVDQQIRQAQARHGNFVNGIPNHRDNAATDYFERIQTELEFEQARVRVAMERAVEDHRRSVFARLRQSV